MAQTPAEAAELVELLQVSKWFRHIDAKQWGTLALRLERVRLEPGEVLFNQGDAGDAMYVVVAGRLKAFLQTDDGAEVPLAEMLPGESVGEIQVLTGGRRTASVRAGDDSELIRIPTSVFDELLRRSPETLREIEAVNQMRLHRSLLAQILPGLFGPLDEDALDHLESKGEWLELRRGETLFEQGAPGDSCYFLLRGRLAAVLTDGEGREHTVAEISRGESVGEMALFTGERRTTGVRASRDSLVVEYSRASFDEVTARYPQVLQAIVRILVGRLSKTTAASPAVAPVAADVRTVALVAAGDVPLAEIASRLTAALTQSGPTLPLSRQTLDQALMIRATHEGDRHDPVEMRISAWLDDQELGHRFVVYEGDPEPSAWTRRCMRQADLILLLASAEDAPEAVDLDRLTGADDRDDIASRSMLLLLHADGSNRPRGTGRWLDALGLDRHVHLRRSRAGDVERLARMIAGRSVGLALGGGGARAFAHIGVLRALEEAGIEIDAIGGTSFGSFMAAEYAMGWSPDEMIEINRKTVVEGKLHREFTVPIVSVLGGRRAARVLEELFAGVEVEDLWLSYFAVSANLTTARQVIHRRGSLRKALWASMAVPGVVAPAISGEDLLVDGGLLNNLPGDVVRRLWGGRVITVDVSSSTEMRVDRAVAGLPSSWALLRNRLNPLAQRIEIPNIFEILMRSSTLASAQAEAAAKAEADLYLKPPVEKFKMFGVADLDRLVEIGYRHAKERLADWDG